MRPINDPIKAPLRYAIAAGRSSALRDTFMRHARNATNSDDRDYWVETARTQQKILMNYRRLGRRMMMSLIETADTQNI